MKKLNKYGIVFILISLMFILSLATSLYTQENRIGLAVAAFDDTTTPDGENEKSGSAASSMFESAIKRSELFQVRESDAVSNYIKNLELLQTGFDNSEALNVKSGDLLIDYLAVGTVSKFGSQYEVDSRIVDVNTWSIIFSRGISSKSISSAVDYICNYISDNLKAEYISERKKNRDDNATVSVYNLKDYNMKAQNAGLSGAFSEMLNSSLGSCELVTAVEKKFTDALVNEKVLEMTGVIENERSDSGLILKGIEYKLSGDIRVFQDVICINYKLYSTEDGRLVYMSSNEITSPSALRPSSRIISKNIEDVLNNRVGTVKVTTNPSGAAAFIGDELIGKTPLMVSLPKGVVNLVIKKDGYELSNTDVTIKPKVIEKISVNLQILKPDDLTKNQDGKIKQDEQVHLANEKAEQEALNKENAEKERLLLEGEQRRKKNPAGNMPAL